MSQPSRRSLFPLMTCLGLCLALSGCGSPQSEEAGQGKRPAQSQAGAPTARILANQVGYEPSGTKKAVIQGQAGDAFAGFTVRSYPGGEVVLSGAPVHVGPVAKWKDWDFWTVDWSAVKDEGTYVIECSPRAITAGEAAAGKAAPGAVRSHPVLVQKNALARNTLSDVIYYFKGQRSSGLWDKADRTMTFDGRAGAIDMRGGWFDATGDYGKHLSHLSYSSYFNPQQVSLTAWSLFMALRELERRDEPAFLQYRKRLLDEALFGADYLVRSKDPNGSFYITVSGRGPEKKPEDRRITAKAERHIILTTETKDKFRDYGREKIAGDAAYEAGYREGAGLCIAALAMAAARGGADGQPGNPGYGVSRGEGDFTARDYLKAAEDAFAFLEKNNLLFANDGKENIIDDYCALIAATELYRTTKRAAYREAADRRAASLEARLASWTDEKAGGGAGATGTAGGSGKSTYTDYWRADDSDRPFFHPVDAGMPVVSLLVYAEIADEEGRAKALEAGKEVSRVRARGDGRGDQSLRLQPSARPVEGRGGDAPVGFLLPSRHRDRALVAGRERPARVDGRGGPDGGARFIERSGRKGQREDLQAGGRRGIHRPSSAPSASDQLNWILGLNPYDACMLHGHGRNNIAYMFFDSYEYTNAPGGICNGITGGATEDTDIDFGLALRPDGQGRRLALGRTVAPPRRLVPLRGGLGGLERGRKRGDHRGSFDQLRRTSSSLLLLHILDGPQNDAILALLFHHCRDDMGCLRHAHHGIAERL